jgi:capsular polysaccharide transport system permease protein
MQLDQTMAAAPGSPGVPSLRNRIGALAEQIAAERARVAGNDDALAGKIAAYERIALDRQFADQALASAMLTLELARQEARRQVIYIETIAAPNRPDEPTEPRRWRAIATVAFSGFAVFAMLWLAVAGAREHADG